MVQPEWLLPLALLVVIFSPRLVVVLLVLGAGFAGGVYAATRDKPKIATLSSDSTLEERLRKMDLVQPQLLSSIQTNLSSQIVPTTLSVPLDVNVLAAQSRLISLIVKDFIKSWYEAINLSHSDEFPNAVTASLHSAFLTLGEAAAKTKVVHIVSPITQTLIRHIYEYRILETSALPLDVYLERNPRSSFNRYVDAKESNKFLRKLSAHIISVILPKQDSESPVVFSILREIVATSVLGGIVDTYSDSDYINQALIAYITSVKEAAATIAIDASYGDEYEDIDFAPVPASISTLDQGPATSSNQPNPSSSKRNNASAHKETKQKPSSVSKEKQIKSAVTNPAGDQLYVKVVEAKHMPMGQGSFFCSVSFGNSTLRSEKVASDTQPYWKEDFLFDWSHSMKNTYIRIDIYDALMIRDAFIGSVYILASDVQANKYSKEWYPIDTSESRVASGAQMAQLNVEAMVISISNLDRMEEPGTAENHGVNVEVPALIPSPVLEETVNEENEWEDMNLSVGDHDEEIEEPLHLMDESGESLSIETLAASSMDSLQVLEPKPAPKNQYVLDPLPSFSTSAPLVVSFQPRPEVAEPLTVAEAIRHPFYKDNFESYLDSYQALEYLHLYRDLMIMKPDIRLDEARDIYSIYFHTQTNVNVDRATLEDLKSLVTGESHLSAADDAFRKDLFERIKMEVLETLDMFWIKFQAQPGFQVPPDPAHVEKSNAFTPQQKHPPTKPPRAGTVQDSDKSVAVPQSASPLSQLVLEPPAENRPTVPARPKISPPLPLRESPHLEAVAPTMPPPLPSRPSAQEEEAEARRKREEDDLMLALALQEEENRNAAAVRNAAHHFPERRSSNHPNHALDLMPGGGNVFFSAPAVARSTHLSGPIASEIAIVKERIMVIEQRLGDTAYPVEGGHELVENKVKLQSLLVRLSEMFALAEETEFQSSYSSVPTMVHLYNAKVSITDLSDFDGSESINAKEYLSGLLFGVQVEPTGSASASTGGWVLTRTLTQFSMCHYDLSSIFPKMEKYAFPAIPPTSLQLKPQSTSAADARATLCADLEAWVRIILSDQVLCQAMCVHELLQSERLMSRIEEARKSEIHDRQQQQQQQLQRSGGTVRGQVFGALKSAGSVLKNVAVSTGSVIGNAAAAVARDVKEEFSESAKLVGGGEVKRSGSQSVNGVSGSRSAGNTSYDPYRLKASAAEYSSLPTANSSDSDLPNSEEPRNLNTPARKSRSPTRDEQSRKSGRSPSPTKSKGYPQAVPEESQMSPQELAILLECAFGIIEEVFNLSDPNQWIRQKGLQVVKSVLRNNYGKTISTSIQTQVDDIRSPESVSGYLNSISDNLWPNGEWMYSTPDYLAELEANKLNPRTDQQRTDTRIEAKDLFLNNAALLGLDGIQTVVGKTNTTVGLSRLFNMLQQRDLNRGLVCAVLEAMVRSVLSD